METETMAVTARIVKKNGGKLPRGVHRRGNSLVVSFALADGTIERRSLGSVSAGFAQEQLGIFKRQVRQGEYQKRQPRQVERKETTCADLWKLYLADAETRGKRTDRLATAWTHLKAQLGARAANGIKPLDIVNYTAARRAEGVTNGCVNRELACLKACLRYGARLEVISHAPMFPRRLPEAKPRQGFIEDQTYQTLVTNCRELWLRTFLALGFNYGFRKSEMLNLCVRNVDLLGGWLTLETSKNGEGRKVKLTGETRTLLTECVRDKEPNDSVLTRQDGSVVAQPRKAWYSLCTACGLGKLDDKGRYTGLQMHDLRRSAVRRLVRRGIGEKVAMAISGHKTRSVFDRYNITNERDLENAAKLIEHDNPSAGTTTDTKTDTSAVARS
jgi:integrase